MSEAQSHYPLTELRVKVLDFIQSRYTRRRIKLGNAEVASTSAIAFDNLREFGFINGFRKSADDLTTYYNDNIRQFSPEEPLMSPSMVWVAMSIGAVQILLTIAGFKNIDHAGHWSGFLPISED